MWRWFSESQLQVRRCLRLPQVSFVVYTWQCCVDNDTVRRLGVTFDQFVCLGRCNGAVVEAHRASDISLQHFRSTVIAICSQQPTEKTSFLVSRLVEWENNPPLRAALRSPTPHYQLLSRNVRTDRGRPLVSSWWLSRWAGHGMLPVFHLSSTTI